MWGQMKRHDDRECLYVMEEMINLLMRKLSTNTQSIPCSMRKLFLFLALTGVVYGYTDTDPIFISDGTQADVQAAHDDPDCGDGDTITMPTGSFNWIDGDGAPGLSITKNIHLQGNGVENTSIVIDNGSGSDATVISTSNLDPGEIRISGISFEQGTATSATVAQAFAFNGTGFVIVESCDFEAIDAGPVMRVNDAVWGVMANCNVTVGNQTFIWFFNGYTLRDGSGSFGNETWLQPVDFGGGSAFFVEDCVFSAKDGNDNYNVVDTYASCQFVFRHCVFDGVHCSSHGTGDGSGIRRGPRKFIYHDCVFSDNLAGGLSQVAHRNRGGPALYYNLTFEDLTGNALIMSYYRFRSPHGKHLIFPTKGVDQWTVEETGNVSTDPSVYATLSDTGIGWTIDEHIDRVLTIDCTDAVDYRSEDSSTISSVDTGNEEITFTSTHSFTAGEHVRAQKNGGTLPAGLSQNTSYFITVVDTDTVTLSATPTGGAINLTSAGSGSPIIEGVGQEKPGFWKFDHLSSAIASNTADTLVGEDGQQSVWTNHQWFLGGHSYEIVTPVLGWDMPGAGICYATPETATWRDGLKGETNSSAWILADFTTNFGADANQLNIVMISGENNSPFDDDEIVQAETTGTLPAPLVINTDYYIVNRTNTTVELSATEGGAPINLTSNGTGTHAINLMFKQEIDGCYAWNNDYGTTKGMNANPGVAEDKFWFQETGGYNGSAGMGVGLISARPASPALVNTAYWATDTETLSAWRDTTGNGSGDTWTDIYTEYTYPHPLRSDTSSDVTAPTPDPMTFAVAPAASGPSSISMTATTATDVTGPVLYKFRTEGTTETGWRSSPAYTATGLTPSTEYDFEVKARDSASTPNETAYSAISSATTAAATGRPDANVTTLKISGTIRVEVIEP